MKVRYVNSILRSVKNVFISMLDMKVRFENPIKKNLRHPSYDISSIIRMSGDLSGCIVISYPKEIAKTVASEMLREEFVLINDEAIDAINEIANMVTGAADTELDIDNVSYTLPTVFLDRSKITYPQKSFVFSMPCVMDSGDFEVDIALCEDKPTLT